MNILKQFNICTMSGEKAWDNFFKCVAYYTSWITELV